VENTAIASTAVKTVFLRWERRFLLMGSQTASDKGDDMRDISIRLRNALAGITVNPLEDIPVGCVLATILYFHPTLFFLPAGPLRPYFWSTEVVALMRRCSRVRWARHASRGFHVS